MLACNINDQFIANVDTDDLVKARQKLPLAEITSQLESDCNSNHVGDGPRRSTRKRFIKKSIIFHVFQAF